MQESVQEKTIAEQPDLSEQPDGQGKDIGVHISNASSPQSLTNGRKAKHHVLATHGTQDASCAMHDAGSMNAEQNNGAPANGSIGIMAPPKRQGHNTDPTSTDDAGVHASLSNETGENITVMSADTIVSVKGRARGGSKAKARQRAVGKGRKRKRVDGDEEASESGDSEIYTPSAMITKSGRSVQRPMSFVPPPTASPVAGPTVKKKRIWRRNPENAVCKLCLRGVSPASNMIVFCDGCNTPYHRWCHHPPIDQSVIDETDKEWYCRQCRKERIVPVAETDVAHFVPAIGVTMQQRQKYFSGLTPGAMVTLLTRVTTLEPNLPLFDPDFAAKHGSSTGAHASDTRRRQLPATLGTSLAQTNDLNNGIHQPATIYVNHDDEDEDEGYGPEEHPAHYVRPGKGLMSTLPPDKDDEAYLVDEDSSKGVFHHVYLVDEKAANDGVQ